jgi:hypothetical protein
MDMGLKAPVRDGELSRNDEVVADDIGVAMISPCCGEEKPNRIFLFVVFGEGRRRTTSVGEKECPALEPRS